MNHVTYIELVIGNEAIDQLTATLEAKKVEVERHWFDTDGYLHLELGTGEEELAAELLEHIAPALALELGRDSDGRGEVILTVDNRYERIQLEAETLPEAARALEQFRATAKPLPAEIRDAIESEDWFGLPPLEPHVDDTPDEAQEWAPIEGPDPCQVHDIASNPPDCLFED